jgi:hypothetical protein
MRFIGELQANTVIPMHEEDNKSEMVIKSFV